ncbi:MAG: PD40 domain-containing protein, partial [Deltaproteobacteria bacterium]|nr:PD40 domain-containing protein [Deltaproteobacteria bacterium]
MERQKGGWLALVIVFGWALVACGNLIAGEQTPARDDIVFVSYLDGNQEIYLSPSDGSRVVRLTNNDKDDLQPELSRDGSRIVFTSLRDGNPEIYVMNGDGTGQRRLTRNPGFDAYPQWSPEGKRIAFVSDRSGPTELYAMDADGTGVTKLTQTK